MKFDSATHQKRIELLNQYFKKHQNQISLRPLQAYMVSSNLLQTGLKRTSSNYPLYQDQKSLLDRIICKIMCGSSLSGKKSKATSIVVDALDQIQKTLEKDGLFCLWVSLIRSIPLYEVRRLKYGGGYLTKRVHLTVRRQISWFVKNLIKVTKGVKISQRIANQLISTYKGSSKLMVMKKQLTDQANRCNLL